MLNRPAPVFYCAALVNSESSSCYYIHSFTPTTCCLLHTFRLWFSSAPISATLCIYMQLLHISFLLEKISDSYFSEGDVLLCPEVVVPVLRLLPQVSQPFLQLWFVLGDVVNYRPQVWQRVRWTDPVVCGAGWWSEVRFLQIKIKNTYLIVFLLGRMKVRDFRICFFDRGDKGNSCTTDSDFQVK